MAVFNRVRLKNHTIRLEEWVIQTRHNGCHSTSITDYPYKKWVHSQMRTQWTWKKRTPYKCPKQETFVWLSHMPHIYHHHSARHKWLTISLTFIITKMLSLGTAAEGISSEFAFSLRVTQKRSSSFWSMEFNITGSMIHFSFNWARNFFPPLMTCRKYLRYERLKC